MRKLAVALFAAPVITLIYVHLLLRRSVAARVGLVLGVGGVLGLAVVAGLGLDRASADVPSVNAPLPQAAFTVDLRVSQGIRQPVTLHFSQPMDEASVAGSLRVEPAAAYSMTWNADGTSLTVTPVDGWVAGTYYAVSVGRDAVDKAGHQLEAPARAAFLTRPSYAARFNVPEAQDGVIPLDARFVAIVPGDVDPDQFAAAIRVTPVVPGRVVVRRIGEAAAPTEDPTWEAVFQPDRPLAPGTEYTISLDPALVDRDGAPVAVGDPLTVRTAPAPSVVRFRPRDKTTKVDRAATLSVRFTEPMDQTTTAKAFGATVDGVAVSGKVRWAENDTVLVLDPTKDFGYSAKVTMTVSADARSALGIPIEAPATATFTTVPKPAPTPTPKPVAKTTPIPKTGGGTVAAGTWSAVENYYLKLLNCTRTGGWVTSTGACKAGSNGTKPLWMDAGIQRKMARPYAKVLATTGACSHTADGTFVQRLARAGYSGFRRAGENVGCGNGDPYRAMLADHLFFQNEKSTNGGHYLNIMNPIYDRVGVGVYVYGYRVRLVTDFYRP